MSDILQTARFATSLGASYRLAAGALAVSVSYQRVAARVAGRRNAS